MEWSGVELKWSGVEVGVEWSRVELEWSGVEWSGVEIKNILKYLKYARCKWHVGSVSFESSPRYPSLAQLLTFCTKTKPDISRVFFLYFSSFVVKNCL